MKKLLLILATLPLLLGATATITVNEDTTLQALMIEAANMLFRSRGKAAIAK